VLGGDAPSYREHSSDAYDGTIRRGCDTVP
jgi:hypothetical protein